MIATAALLTWILTDRMREKYLWSSPAVLWLFAAALLMFAISRAIAWLLSRTEKRNAAELDRLYNLKERISTYIEIKNGSHPFLEPLVHETCARLTDVSTLRVSGAATAMRLPVFLLSLPLTALLVLPYLPVPQSIVMRKQEYKEIKEKAKEMEKLANDLEKKNADSPELKKLAQEMRKVAKEIQKPQIEKAELLKKLNALEEKQRQLLADHQNKLTSDLQKALEKAEKNNGEKSAPPSAEKAEMDKLVAEWKQALEGGPADQKQTDRLQAQNFDSSEITNLKEALKQYQKQKAQAEEMRKELKKALDGARSKSAAGKSRYTTDSRLKERDTEKGKGGVEDGAGTTNQDTGPSHFDTKKKGKEEYVEDRTKAEYERLYEGQRENVGKDPLYLESQWNQEGDPKYTNVRNFGVEKETSTGTDSPGIGKQNQGESEVKKERVPPSHEKIVKEYFESIEE